MKEEKKSSLKYSWKLATMEFTAKFVFEHWEMLNIALCTFLHINCRSSWSTTFLLFAVIAKLKPIFIPAPDIWASLASTNDSKVNENENNVSPCLDPLRNFLFSNILDFATVWFDYTVNSDRILTNQIQRDNQNIGTTTTDNFDHQNFNTTTHSQPQQQQPTLLVGYHSRPSLDLLFLMARYQTITVVHDLLLDIPLVGDTFKQLGCISSRAHHYNNNAEQQFVKALSEGKAPVLSLPGGAYECFKSYSQYHKVLWKSPPGFATLILRSENRARLKSLRIIPVYTRNCEKMFYCPYFLHELVTDHSRRLMPYVRRGHFYLIPYALTLCFASLGFMMLPTGKKLDTFFGNPVDLESFIREIEQSSTMSHSAAVCSFSEGPVDGHSERKSLTKIECNNIVADLDNQLLPEDRCRQFDDNTTYADTASKLGNTVQTRLEQLIDTVNSSSDLLVVKNRENDAKVNIPSPIKISKSSIIAVSTRTFWLLCYKRVKMTVHLLLLSTQCFVGFSLSIIFAWLVYFPIAVIAFVTRKVVEGIDVEGSNARTKLKE